MKAAILPELPELMKGKQIKAPRRWGITEESGLAGWKALVKLYTWAVYGKVAGSGK
jgi:hypothetical protein